MSYCLNIIYKNANYYYICVVHSQQSYYWCKTHILYLSFIVFTCQPHIVRDHLSLQLQIRALQKKKKITRHPFYLIVGSNNYLFSRSPLDHLHKLSSFRIYTIYQILLSHIILVSLTGYYPIGVFSMQNVVKQIRLI